MILWLPARGYKFQTDDVSARLAKERYFIDVFLQNKTYFDGVTIYTYLRTHICVHMCTHILLMTSLGNYAYFDAINVKYILMTSQIKRTLCTHVYVYFSSDVAKKHHIF